MGYDNKRAPPLKEHPAWRLGRCAGARRKAPERSQPLIWKGALSSGCAFVFVRTGFYIAGWIVPCIDRRVIRGVSTVNQADIRGSCAA